MTNIDRTTPFQVGEWRVEPATDRLICGDQEVKLEPRVMDLLLCLASRPGEVITREQLEATVWSGMVVGYDALTSAMIKLRRAFNDNSRNPQIIETVAKRGYRLIAKVTLDNSPLAESSESSEGNGSSERRENSEGSPAEPIEPANHQPPAPRRSSSRNTAAAAAAITVVFAVVIAVGLYRFTGDSSVQTPPSNDRITEHHVTRPAIVVLPFVNMSDNPEQEYFSDGITEDLIIDLSRFSGLLVIARHSSFIYKKRSADIPTLAKELGVDFVVEGSVRRNKDSIRVNVQLVDAATGSNLWAQRFDRKTQDIFSVQDDIRRNIINAMSITLTEEEEKREQRRYTNSFEAYDYFLHGQSSLVKRASAADNNQARDFMKKALALDANFARATAALALTYADAYRFNWSDDPQQTVKLAIDTGERAVQLDPQSPQAYWILGYIDLFVRGDHKRAIEMGERAIQLDPNNSDGYTVLGVTYVFNNEPERAKTLMQHLMRINPHYPSQVPSILGLANLLLGDYEESLKAYDDSLLINPTRVQPNVVKIVVLVRMGRLEDAQWQVDQLLSLHPDFDPQVWADRQPFRDQTIIRDFIRDLKRVGLG